VIVTVKIEGSFQWKKRTNRIWHYIIFTNAENPLFLFVSVMPSLKVSITKIKTTNHKPKIL